MKVIASKPLSVQMIDDCSDPREGFEIPPGEHTVKRVMSAAKQPWLLFPEPNKPDTFYIGLSELWMRKHGRDDGITIEDTVDDKVAFLVSFGDAIDQWASFDSLGRQRPNFTRRQLSEQSLSDDQIDSILGKKPMDQYRAIGKLGLEYKLSPFTEAELRALLT